MHLLPLQLSLLLTALPALSFAAYEPAPESSAEPTTTVYSTSTNTITKTIVAASVTQTLTSETSIASIPLSTFVSVLVESAPISAPSSSSIALPPSSAAPYPIPSSSAIAISGTVIGTGTGAPAVPSSTIEPFLGAGSRIGGGWVGVVGAMVVGLGMLVV